MYKGTSKLILSIKEEINTMQYDNSSIPDVGEVYGSIICKVMILSTSLLLNLNVYCRQNLRGALMSNLH